MQICLFALQTLNPKWNEEFYFRVSGPSLGDVLTVAAGDSWFLLAAVCVHREKPVLGKLLFCPWRVAVISRNWPKLRQKGAASQAEISEMGFSQFI